MDQARTAHSPEHVLISPSLAEGSLPEDVELSILYKPARHVGGDLYDFHVAGLGKAGLCVADIAGKGAAAATLVAGTISALRGSYSQGMLGTMRGVDSYLVSTATEDSFVTMVYGVLDLEASEFVYLNAGHMPPIVVPASGPAVAYEHADPPLGLGAARHFTEKRIPLERGDILVLYTDGVTDALAPEGDGVAEFRAVLDDLGGRDIHSLGQRLALELADPKRVDDVTVVAARIRA